MEYTSHWSHTANHDAWWWGTVARLLRDLVMFWSVEDADSALPRGAASYDHPDVQHHFQWLVGQIRAMAPHMPNLLMSMRKIRL